MKINELTQMSDAALFESINSTNDSGISTADLVQVVRADQLNQWTAYKGIDDFNVDMDALLAHQK